MILLSKYEQRKIEVITKLLNKEITTNEACLLLSLSDRQIRRIKNEFNEKGVKGIPHKSRGKSTGKGIDDKTKQYIKALYINEFDGWNFSHFTETLSEEFNIHLSKSKVYSILTDAGIKSPQAKKKKGKIHPSRKRRECFGELIQVDASKHDWLLNGSYLHLHGGIDDATGLVMPCYFSKEETTKSYYIISKAMYERYGIPRELYSDNRGTFYVNNKKELTIEEELAGKRLPLTNFGSAMKDLKITTHSTSCPMAKGRIERLWRTFQDRLINEMKRQGIKSIEEANEFLPKFIENYNSKFALRPYSNKNAFRKLDDSYNLDYILSWRKEVSIHKNCYFCFQNKYYLILDDNNVKTFTTKQKIDVRKTLDGQVIAYFNNSFYETKIVRDIEAEVKQMVYESIKVKPTTTAHKPPSNHPWRNSKPIHHNQKLINAMNTN